MTTPSSPDFDPATSEYTAEEEAARDAQRRQRRRRVLLGAFLFVLAALALVPIWPWLLPAFIYEGPFLQNMRGTSVDVIWYLSRPTSAALTVELEGRSPIVARCEGKRCAATLDELPLDTELPYRIRLAGRTLAADRLHTPRSPEAVWTFAVFGDSGKGTRAQYLLARRITAAEPHFVVHTGDLIYSRGERYLYRERFFEPYAALLRRAVFWPCVGNHDVFPPVEDSPFFAVFELPENGPPGVPTEQCYWFDYANARFVVINSELDEQVLARQVAPWVAQVLGDETATWRFVVLHRPPYTAGKHPPRLQIQRALGPTFENAGVDVVFSGHDHMYERTWPVRDHRRSPDGTGPVYVVSGAGGARLYEALPLDERPDYIAVLNNEVFSFTFLEISGPRLRLKQIDLDGNVIDDWTLEKPVE